jgi:hypothetical protein
MGIIVPVKESASLLVWEKYNNTNNYYYYNNKIAPLSRFRKSIL